MCSEANSSDEILTDFVIVLQWLSCIQVAGHVETLWRFRRFCFVMTQFFTVMSIFRGFVFWCTHVVKGWHAGVATLCEKSSTYRRTACGMTPTGAFWLRCTLLRLKVKRSTRELCGRDDEFWKY